MGNNIQIFGRTFSDVSSITVNNTSSSAVKYVQEPIFEDITIGQDYLAKQNTVVSNGIIFQTDETYPGTPVVLNNTTVANIDNGNLGQNGIGIKIELNRTYHCTGELKIEWSTGEQEIYSIDSDFTPTNYNGVSYLSFSWEGIGTSTQTFDFMYLNFVSSSYSGYKFFMRPTRTGQITKSGVLLDGSYYQISVTSDGFNTINLNLSDDPGFQAIYKSLAYRSVIASSAPGVSEWCDNLSKITSYQFNGKLFNGTFNFNNVSKIDQYAFAEPDAGQGMAGGNFIFSFPSLTSLSFAAFYYNRAIKEFYANQLSVIESKAFHACAYLNTISFPECTLIKNNAFYGCYSLTTASFSKCTSIQSYVFYNCSGLTTISFPKCIVIDNFAFYNCKKLNTVSFPKCTSIASNAFQNCSSLTTISFPECTSIGSSAFQNCKSLTTISFPECTSIDGGAFQNCKSLTAVSFPECTSIGSSAFYDCSSLNTVSFPKCASIASNAFQNCSNLTTVSFPECTSINNTAFQNCTNLTIASFPKCTIISNNTFQNCINLTTISFPECITIGTYVFSSCSSLTTVSFSKCTSIGNYAFGNCSKLESAYFMGSSIPSIGTYIFTNTPMVNTAYLGYYGSIYVPSSLLTSYKTATNWAQYSFRMVGI